MTGADTQVVVIGAGLSGLTAAVDLAAAGTEVTVLEARRRVGGRMHGIPMSSTSCVDGGAAYLGVRHTELLVMLRENGLELASTEMSGDSTFLLSGERTTTAGRVPPLDAVALGDLFDRLEGLVAEVCVEAPWAGPRAEYLDGLTVAQWIEEEIQHPAARTFFPLFIGEMMAADPALISVLHMAFYLRSGGGIRYLNAFQGGAQEWRIDGGAHQLCELLARRLGHRIRLGREVRAVDQTGDDIVVHATSTVDGSSSSYRADHVVVALPPLLAQQIDFLPGLPAPRATPATGRGCAVKVHLSYPSPLWRDHGLSGWSVSTDGPLLSTVDDSPADRSAGILTGFVTGAAAPPFSALSLTEQTDAVLAHARRLFPRLPAPTKCSVTDWLDERYSKGCYAALYGPGDWMQLGPTLTEPHGRVHWAGTETSLEFFGLMEGAIRSGRRAADELINGADVRARSRKVTVR